jgi:predicted DNA-binding mobile mystery protein A
MDLRFRSILLDGLEQKIGRLNTAVPAAERPARGWLRAVREAIGLTQGEVAAKIAVKRQSYAQFETAEEHGSISLASLGRAAAAMGCELVYFVVPSASAALSYKELARIHDPAAGHLSATEHSMSLKNTVFRDDGH